MRSKDLRIRRRLDMSKATRYTIAINAMQVLGALTVTAFSLVSGGHAFTGLWEQMLLASMTLIVCWGAILDIREAFNARDVADEADMLEDAYGKLEQLNGTLKAQRHDFMNHLQVVYSLLELNEYQEAEEYIDRVYGDIKRVSRTLKTAHPAINALLAAKVSDCEARGITVELVIESLWQALPMPSWEMCRVLGNLLDNAMDALGDTEQPRLEIRLGESLHACSFEIANNGPEVPTSLKERIFQDGFSTKGTGRGTGLAIVRNVLKEHGGQIELISTPGRTAFRGEIAKGTSGSIAGQEAGEAKA